MPQVVPENRSKLISHITASRIASYEKLVVNWWRPKDLEFVKTKLSLRLSANSFACVCSVPGISPTRFIFPLRKTNPLTSCTISSLHSPFINHRNARSLSHRGPVQGNFQVERAQDGRAPRVSLDTSGPGPPQLFALLFRRWARGWWDAHGGSFLISHIAMVARASLFLQYVLACMFLATASKYLSSCQCVASRVGLTRLRIHILPCFLLAPQYTEKYQLATA